MADLDKTPIAYSYVRFSHPDQAKGDSLRRQTEAAAEWCNRNKVCLDTATTFRDLGRSAFTGAHRSNPDRHALASFLKLIEGGRVPRGSYLVIENLDRLSREHVQPALLLVLNLLQAGVRIVQLKPAEMVFDDKSDAMAVMMMVMELSRGHGESAIKSERVGAAWARKKQGARDHGEVLTHRLPAWVEERDGKLHLIPDRAATVRRIFALATGGYGTTGIVRRLTEDGVPAFGDSGRWIRSYLNAILKDRRALGEFQPRRRDGTPDGAPIPAYYPAAVSEAEWDLARERINRRRILPGRTGEHVNPFAGLLRDARGGGTYFCGTRTARYRPPRTGRATWRVLINTSSTASSRCWSFPFDVFERAVLSMLREVDPKEVLGKADGDAGEVQALARDLAQVEAKIGELEAELLTGDVAALARVLRSQEARKRQLAEELTEARLKAASPLGESWGRCKGILATLDAAPDPREARLRLRGVLRRIVDSIWILVTPRGLDRLAVVQLWFAGGARHRDYIVLSRPANNFLGREASWSVRSFAAVAGEGQLDLRDRDHARRLEKVLGTLPVPKK
jgi:DNA invertase Pin-like site-specific DNA recombinase